MKNIGYFFAFEGIDGSGKTTQTKAVAKQISNSYFTAQPSKGPMGRLIREYLSTEKTCPPKALSALFVADRLDHILGENGLLSLKERGEIILCDRYYFSSFAYQTLDQSLEDVITLNQEPRKLFPPDATFYIDVPPEIALKRLTQRGNSLDIFETEEKLKEIYQNYQKAFTTLQKEEKIIIIDGTREEKIITEDILSKIREITEN
ncbi:MAG: dTMP kinase [Eubacteriales bacterium]